MRRSLKRKRNKFTARWAVWRACCAFDEGTLLEAEACLKRGEGTVPFSSFGISSSLLPRPTLFSRKKLPGHPEGADLRENRLAFRGKAACRHPCEPLPANDALGNGVQMEIVPLSRRAGACPSRDAETLERAREPSLALFSLSKKSFAPQRASNRVSPLVAKPIKTRDMCVGFYTNRRQVCP